jgi:hypothetical protein
MSSDIGYSMYCYPVDTAALPELFPISKCQAELICAKRGNASTLEFLNLDADDIANCMHDGEGNLYQMMGDAWYCFNGTLNGLGKPRT